MRQALLGLLLVANTAMASTAVYEFNNKNTYVLKKVEGQKFYKNLKASITTNQARNGVTSNSETSNFDPELLTLEFTGDYEDGVVNLKAKAQVDFMNDLDQQVQTNGTVGQFVYRTVVRPVIKFFLLDSLADETTSVSDSGKVTILSDAPLRADVKTSFFYKHKLKSVKVESNEVARVLGPQLSKEAQLNTILKTIASGGEFSDITAVNVQASDLECSAKGDNLNCEFESQVTVEVAY